MTLRASLRLPASLPRWLALPVALFFLSACGTERERAAAPLAEAEVLALAQEIHGRVIAIDTHDDIPTNYATPEVNPCAGTRMQVDIPKMEAGGLDMAWLVVYVGQGPRTPEGYQAAKEAALNKFAAIHRVAEELCPERAEIAYRADDVERIVASGKRVIGIGIENGYVVGRDLTLLEEYFGLGARYMTLTHGGHNDIADSSTPRAALGDAEEEHGGLSDFGREVVREMNRLGIMVDVSHVSKKSMLEAARLSAVPIIASHSGARALADHPRNLDDEQLLALKENGGVIQMVALAGFLQVDSPERNEALQALREEFGVRTRAEIQGLGEEARAAYEERLAELDRRWPRPTVSTMVDHIDHVVALIGVDHVGIGTDFDGGGGLADLRDASEVVHITAELVRRGYTEEEIRKIWGGNTLRVWREVERVAARLGGGEGP